MTLARRETATVEECVAALRGLTDSEWQQLADLARVRATGLGTLDSGDLLHGAIDRMLTGKRKWPRDVPLVVFLRETMRSIASNEWRRLEQRVIVAESEMRPDGAWGDGAVEAAPDVSMAPETRVVAAEMLDQIEGVFRDDAEALAVIVGVTGGQSPDEIRRENAMGEKRYATTLRRIRRRLTAAFGAKGEAA